MVNFWTENVNKYLVRLGSKRSAFTLVFKDDDSFSHNANFLGKKKIHRDAILFPKNWVGAIIDHPWKTRTASLA